MLPFRTTRTEENLMRILIVACMALSMASGAWAQNRFSSRFNAQPPADSVGETALSANNCEVKLIRTVQVPAEVEGMLTELPVEEGQQVEKGKVIGVVDDKQAKLMLQLKEAEEAKAMIQAENTVNLRDARNSAELAAAEYKSFQDLLDQRVIPYWDVEKKRLEAERQKLRIELADMEQQQAKIAYIATKRERQLAELEIERRQIKVPFGGYVERRIAQLGEWVQPGSPIIELLQMDRLRIEGDIDVTGDPGKVHVGTPVHVTIGAEASDNPIEFDAQLGFVSANVDINNRRRIWLEFDNQRDGDEWLVLPGMQATITIKPGAAVN